MERVTRCKNVYFENKLYNGRIYEGLNHPKFLSSYNLSQSLVLEKND